MQAWLTAIGIPWSSAMLKPALYKLIQLHKPQAEYVCDKLAAERGFRVIRLPPYHCVFNPIELIWAWVKREVGRRNKTYKIGDVKTLVLETMEAVPQDLWPNSCRHCDEDVDKAWLAEGLQREHVASIVISLSDNESSSESEDDDSE
ncbi:uncharacterized protein LOC135813083 [Sycon ciliatum]|uniref:uncharacterized protein LOC135813083 n=1 Tax=Sycon ciliatum TaxID=27933 RepID=UPI0031F6B914